MNSCNIYLDTYKGFGYTLLLEEPNGDIRIMRVCTEGCIYCNKDNLHEIEEISKVINDYENVTVYYEPDHITIINGIKKRCKHAKFEKISLIHHSHKEINNGNEICVTVHAVDKNIYKIL